MGEEEEIDHEDDVEEDEGEIYHDDIDSSKTISEAVQDIIESVPADCLADIYVDKEDGLSESDVEDRGTGTNLDEYLRNNFLIKDATRKWMEWDGK